jgi:UPF0755 protein
MVERPPTLRPPVEPPRGGRPRPSSGQILARRLVALGVLVVALIGLALAGYYALRAAGGESSKPATTRVLAPPPKPFRIIFPEGFTRRQMAERVAAVDRIAKRKRHTNVALSSPAYLAATAKPRRMRGFGNKPYRLEGFLFPATYDFAKRTTSAQLAAFQLRAFQRNWRSVNLSYARSKNLTPYDVLTIASMVEKEAVAPEERAKIAAVIYNRLHAGMNLGIDATLRYGLNIPPTESIHQSQLESGNPYNTRNPNITGLPPTPIANPGLASMQAAAHPAKVDYLYFVRRPDKVHHFFTASASEFAQYEATHGY